MKGIVFMHSHNYPSTDLNWDRFRRFRNRCKSLNQKKMCAYFNDKPISHFKTNKKIWAFYQSSPTDIYQTFNQHFTSLKCDSSFSIENCSNFIHNCFLEDKRNGNLRIKSFSFKKITADIVKTVLNTLDIISSSGITDICIFIIKHCLHSLPPILAFQFNKLIKLGSIPDDLKCAIVFALFKKGDHSNCVKYRGICVLSHFAKIFERISAADITTQFKDNDLLSEAQHGFRSIRSCETIHQTILIKWKQSFEDKQIILAFFIDLQKALTLLILNSFSLNNLIMA